jgi:hypothetical protein
MNRKYQPVANPACKNRQFARQIKRSKAQRIIDWAAVCDGKPSTYVEVRLDQRRRAPAVETQAMAGAAVTRAIGRPLGGEPVLSTAAANFGVAARRWRPANPCAGRCACRCCFNRPAMMEIW